MQNTHPGLAVGKFNFRSLIIARKSQKLHNVDIDIFALTQTPHGREIYTSIVTVDIVGIIGQYVTANCIYLHTFFVQQRNAYGILNKRALQLTRSRTFWYLLRTIAKQAFTTVR